MVVIYGLLVVLVLTFVFGALIAADITEKSTQKLAEKQKCFEETIARAKKAIEDAALFLAIKQK